MGEREVVPFKLPRVPLAGDNVDEFAPCGLQGYEVVGRSGRVNARLWHYGGDDFGWVSHADLGEGDGRIEGGVKGAFYNIILDPVLADLVNDDDCC